MPQAVYITILRGKDNALCASDCSVPAYAAVQVQIQYVEEEADCARFGVRIIREYQREYKNVNFMAVCKMVWEV